MIGKGKILISEPYLGDPNFERTVIMICDDTVEGSVGFILNKPSLLTVDSVLTDLEDFGQTIFIGGPVQQDSLNFINVGKTFIEGSVEIEEGIFWGGEYEHLLELSNLKLIEPTDFKFFLGYSGWGIGQLKNEMDQNSWIIGNTSLREVLEMQPDKMWQNILKNMGGKYKMYSNFPIDPKLN